MRFDPSKVPPTYPKPGANPLRRQGVREARDLQRNPLTRSNFNLYSAAGRLYVGLMLVWMAVMEYGAVALVTGRPRPFADEPWDWMVGMEGALVAPPAVGLGMVLTYFKHRRVTRLIEGRCPRCGYDCRASVEAGRCPECGRVFDG